MFTQQFEALAQYNQRMNLKMYDLVETLPKDLIEKDLGAFFKSIQASLEHILGADLVWLRRFKILDFDHPLYKELNDYPEVLKLNQKLYQELEELKAARFKLDLWIRKWVKEQDQEFWSKDFEYKNMSGVSNSGPLWIFVTHFFNHQTHHRGQVTTLLTQQGYDIGKTDFPFVIKEK